MGRLTGKPYRPSNGTEGDWFDHEYCNHCIRMNPDPEKKPVCSIWVDVMAYNSNDPQYPKEWTYNENDRPTCTAYVKWDWNNDDDPNDPDNPKAPVPEDPMQLCMPFEIEDVPLIKKEQKQVA